MKRKRKPERTYVYLLHFEHPISEHHTAQHYLGFAENLPARIAQHRHGTGSRFCAVAKERHIEFKVARIWEGNRHLERSLKNRKKSNYLCPICNPAASQMALFADDEHLMKLVQIVNHDLLEPDDVQF